MKWIFRIFGLIIFALLSFLGVCIYKMGDKIPQDKIKFFPIVSLRDEQEIHGGFFLGISSDNCYCFYENLGNDEYKLRSVASWKVSLLESDSISPRVLYVERDIWHNERIFKIIIPKNSIIKHYEVR